MQILFDNLNHCILFLGFEEIPETISAIHCFYLQNKVKRLSEYFAVIRVTNPKY